MEMLKILRLLDEFERQKKWESVAEFCLILLGLVVGSFLMLKFIVS